MNDWINGFRSIQIDFLNINTINIKCNLYKFPDEKAGGVSFEKVRDEMEKDLGFSDITATDLQDELIAPINIKDYRE